MAYAYCVYFQTKATTIYVNTLPKTKKQKNEPTISLKFIIASVSDCLPSYKYWEKRSLMMVQSQIGKIFSQPHHEHRNAISWSEELIFTTLIWYVQT